MKLVIISVAAVALLLTGCEPSGTTINQCKSSGYAGIAIPSEYREPTVRCSDGKYVNGQLRAEGGLYNTKPNQGRQTQYVFLPFAADYKPSIETDSNNINISIDNSSNKNNKALR